MAQPQYVGLLIREYASGQQVWVKTLRATAEHFGWTDAYDVIGESYTAGPSTRSFITAPIRRWRPDIGGRKRRICRAESRQGYPAGQTNVIRISSKVTNADLAELARLTKGEWAWMESTCGKRRSKEEWLAIP